MFKSKSIKILFIGDISARPGRRAVHEVLQTIKRDENVDVVIANCENAAGGRGVTREIIDELVGYGVDYFTAGEHVWDIADFYEELSDVSLPLVRPFNYEATKILPGKGWDVIDLGSKGKLIVACLLGNEFMRGGATSPFWAFDRMYEEMKQKVEGIEDVPIILDFHAEVTSEKRALGWYLKDKVTAVLGTHTHVPTADPQILPRSDLKQGGCAYVTDVGMCGSQHASLWVDFDIIIHNFRFPNKSKFKVEKKGPRVFNSVLVEIENNFAKKIERVDKTIE